MIRLRNLTALLSLVFLFSFFINFVPQVHAQSITYKFPWPAGQSWQLTPGRPMPWHSGDSCEKEVKNPEPPRCGIDFLTTVPNATGLAMAPGKITGIFFCDKNSSGGAGTTANIFIKHDDGVTVDYLHFDKTKLASGITVGATVKQGQPLGVLKYGNFAEYYNNGDGCGFGTQGDNQAHIHITIPTTPFTIDGWTFDYPNHNVTSPGNPDKNVGNSFLSTNGTNNSKRIYTEKAGDFNGDGIDDLIVVNQDNDYYIKTTNSAGTGFGNQWRVEFEGKLSDHQWKIGKINKDKMSDLIVLNTNNDAYVKISTGAEFTSFEKPVKFPGEYATNQWDMADFNGDSMDDLIVATKDNDYYVALSQKTKFAEFKKWTDYGGKLADHQWKIGNFNGDKYQDIVVVDRNHKYYVSTSNGSGFIDHGGWADQGGDIFDHQWIVTQMNRDTTDIISRPRQMDDIVFVNAQNDYYVMLSDGTKFNLVLVFDYQGNLSDHQWKVGDIDNDGFKDIVVVNPEAQFYVSRANKGSFISLDFPGQLKDIKWDIGKINTGGALDLVVSDKNNDIYVALSKKDRFANPTKQIDYGGVASNHELKLGKYNSDGLSDLVLASPDNDYYFATANGSGGLVSQGGWADFNGLLADHQWK